MARLRQVAFPSLRGTILEHLLDQFIVVHEELEPQTWHPSRPLELLTIFVTDAGRAFTSCQSGRIEQQHGSVVVVGQGTILSQQVLREPWRSHYVMLGGAFTQELNACLRALPLGAFRTPPQAMRARALINLVETALAARPGWSWQVLRHLTELMSGLMVNFSPRADNLEQRIASVLDTDPQRSWSVRDVADSLDMAPRTLQRRWSDSQSSTVSRFILTQRLLHARLWLQEGRSVTSTSHSHRFSSPFHFSRAYKRVFGHSPAHEFADRHSLEMPSQAGSGGKSAR